MTTEIQVSTKEPSQKLRLIITNCASNFIATGSSLQEVIENGRLEGYSEQQLKTLVAIEIHKQLTHQGLNEKQIKNRLHYIFNANTIKENRNKRYLEQKNSQNNRLGHKYSSNNRDVLNNSAHSDLEDSSSFTDKTELEEIARLQTENNELHEVIKNISFNDNPDLFAVNKNSDTFFANISVVDARTILSNLEDQKKKINIAWEEVQEL